MYEDLQKRLDGSYTYLKNNMPYNVPNSEHWAEEYAEIDAWAKANPSEVTLEEVYEPPVLSLHEQAMHLQLTKREFLKIILALTANTPNPITLAHIEAYVATAPDDIRLEWDYATYIERNHMTLNSVAADFGITEEMLDIVFVNAAEFLRKIDAGEPLYEEA